jgi:hypothetical protein
MTRIMRHQGTTLELPVLHQRSLNTYSRTVLPLPRFLNFSTCKPVLMLKGAGIMHIMGWTRICYRQMRYERRPSRDPLPLTIAVHRLSKIGT